MRLDTNRGMDFRASLVSYVESLSAKRDFSAVVSFFEANRTTFENSTEADSSSAMRLIAKAYSALGDKTTALRIARFSQNLASRHGDSLELAETFVTIGNILRGLGELRESEKAFRDAESIFRRHDNPEGQCRALNLLSGLFFKKNDYQNALSVLIDAIEIARRLNDKGKLAFMLGNIGRIYTFTGKYAEAEKQLLLSIDLLKDQDAGRELARARLSLGYLLMQKGTFASAKTQLETAGKYIECSGSNFDKINYRTYLGELLCRTGCFNEAADFLSSAVSFAEKVAAETTLLAGALRQQAELQLRLREYRKAERTAAKAMAILDHTDDNVETGALLKIKAIVAQKRGQHQSCRKLFARAIDLLDETGVRFEKADALIAAGKSEVFDNRQRLTYLFRAEEYFARAELSARVDEVTRLTEIVSSESENKSGDGALSKSLVRDFPTICPDLVRVKKQLPVIGRSDLPLLLTGETGVGKDHLARYFHSLVRPSGPYVALNCASVPEPLLESELFGYVRGAFTGATTDKQGLFSTANGGVLFLDEIGDMPLHLQTKLLGVLERRKVTPLGSTSEIELNIKLVAASNQNLQEMVECGTFRRDLYYRLSGFAIEIPPLRDRKEDIPLLMQHFLERTTLAQTFGKLPSELVRQFLAYRWPGNTRELASKIKRLEILCELAAEGDLSEIARGLFPPEHSPLSQTLSNRVEEFERQLIVDALTASSGNKSEAARMLGIHEATIRNKVKRYDISLVRIATSRVAS